jgi:hypothetical protein
MDSVKPGGAPVTPYGPWATLGLGMAVMLGSAMAAGLLLMLLHGQALPSGDDGPEMGRYTVVMSAFTSLFGIGALLKLVELRAPGRVADYLALYWVEGGTAARWIGLIVGYLFLSLVVASMLRSGLDVPPPPHPLDGMKLGIVLIATVVIIGPLFEELMFRGFVMEGLSPTPLGPAGALVVSTLLWTLLHIEYDMISMLVVFGCGLLLGIARMVTGSVLLAIAMHAAFNAVSLTASAL